MVPLEHVVLLSVGLFVLGAVGAMTRRNLIVILMSIELMLNAANLALVGFNRAWTGREGAAALDGQVLALLVMTVAAAEVAVGLGLLIALVRNRDSLNVEDASLLKW